MIREVELNVLNRKGEEETMKVKVMPARVFQYGNIAGIVGAVVNKVSKDEALMETVQFYFFGNVDEDWKDKETGELLETFQARIQGNSVEAIGFALQHFPHDLINLISVVSNVPKETVELLDDESLFALLEAVVEVNDLDRLKNLGKKFSSNLKKNWSKQEAEKTQQSHLQNVTQ